MLLNCPARRSDSRSERRTIRSKGERSASTDASGSKAESRNKHHPSALKNSAKACQDGALISRRIGRIRMDKKIAGLLGAVAALTSVPAAQAAAPTPPNPTEAMRAASYADLLTPIPNAVALLDAD